MDVMPTTQDLNADGLLDFILNSTGGASSSVAGGVLTITSPSSGSNTQWFSGTGSAWPGNFTTAGGYTLETRVKVVYDGTQPLGPFGLIASPSDSPGHAWVNVSADGQSWGISGQVPLGASDNSDAYHLFRVATTDHAAFQVWRDGVLIGQNLTKQDNLSQDRILFGNIGTAWGGEVLVDYVRFTQGAYAPDLFREIAAYNSGIPTMAGATGAANPTGQGWTVHQLGTWAHTYDSGDGGWRIVDATSGNNPHYSYALTSEDLGDMSLYGWTLDFTFSMDRHAKRLAGDPLVIDDYYYGTNHWRQNNQTVLIENAEAGYRYDLKFLIDDTNNLWVFDGREDTFLGKTGHSTQGFDLYGTHQLTSDGSAYENFKSMRITYTNGAATLSFDGQEFALSTDGVAALNQVVFGSAGPNAQDVQGSAVWNQFTLRAIPEPGTLVLLVVATMMLLAFPTRRKPSAV